MKKQPLIVTCALLIGLYSTAQTNTFPSAGNVGIGTSTPQQTLHVYNTGNGAVTRVENSTGAFVSGVDGNGGYVQPLTANKGFWLWNAAGTGMFGVNSNGNVGIGTSTPNARLEVAGEIRQSGRTTYLFGANSNQNQALMFAGWGIAHGGIYWRGDSRTFTLNTGDDADNQGQYGNANLVVTGNMGIGINNPGTYKLAVEGTIGARKLKVTQSSWADYVFHPAYKLPSLQEVESYIKAHQHLPDVPSAVEVEKNGLDVGENQAVLLKKIEELTLYVINIQKQVEEQRKMIIVKDQQHRSQHRQAFAQKQRQNTQPRS